MHPRRAFTLIELLFVVGIIAILAAISVPNFLEAQVRSKVARTCSDMATLNAAIRAYSAQYEAYPPNSPQLQDRLDALLRVKARPTPQPAGENREVPAFAPEEREDRRFEYLNESGWDLARLTTPSAWLASSLPVDPFQNRQYDSLRHELRPPAPFSYINRYALFQGDGATSASRAAGSLAGAAGREEENGLKGYILLTVGPDYQISTSNPVRGPFVTYDPSNGTTSGGDILLTAW